MAASLYPMTFVGQEASRFAQHFRVYARENSRVVPPLHFLADVERIIEDEDHVLAVAVKFGAQIAELIGGDESCRERRADGFEFCG
jgi:hypothetical protein